jgi:hypothetical protein
MQEQEFNNYYYTSSLARINQFKLHRTNALGERELFWQDFDQVVLEAIWAGDITPLRDRLTENSRLIAVRGIDIYHYQLALLERIESAVKIPFKYKPSYHYLNREFYRRQGVVPKKFRVGSEVIKGVELEFEKEGYQ